MADWTEQIVVKIRKNTPIGEFNDTIYYTPEQYSSLTPAQIEDAVNERVSKWVSFVSYQSTHPSPPMTRDDWIPILAELNDRLMDSIHKLRELNPPKSVIVAVRNKLQTLVDKTNIIIAGM